MDNKLCDISNSAQDDIKSIDSTKDTGPDNQNTSSFCQDPWPRTVSNLGEEFIQFLKKKCFPSPQEVSSICPMYKNEDISSTPSEYTMYTPTKLNE